MSFINLYLHRYNDIKSLTPQQVKYLYDDFILLPSLSPNDITDLLKLLRRLDTAVLIDPLVINHQLYSFLINLLKDVLKKWHKTSYLIEYESFLLRSITKLLNKISLTPKRLIKPIKKCLDDIAKYGQYLNNNDNEINLKYFSKLVGIYVDVHNEQIMNKVIECLCSKYYVQMFERRGIEKFLLLKCPAYCTTYQGSNKENMANILLNNLLIPSAHLLQTYSNNRVLPTNYLLNLLNDSLTRCCISFIFEIDQLISITDILIWLLKETNESMIIKSILQLLLTLINKNKTILERVKEHEQLFQSFSELQDDARRILNCFQESYGDNLANASSTREDSPQEIDSSHIPAEEDEQILSERTIPSSNSLPPSIFASNKNENKEETTLIWYDPNIGQRDDTEKTAELLQQINDYVLICSNRETCLEYINQIKTEKIFLILSGTSTQDIIDQIHDQKQIDSIYIFCIKRNKYEIYLNNEKYYKIIGIYTEHEPLLIAVQENIRYSIKQSLAGGLFDQNERSMRDLDRRLEEFIVFRAFKQVLLNMKRDKKEAKRQMIEVCRNYYRGNKKELENILEFEQTYQSKDAIYWYTRETFVYRLVNKALRTEDYDALLILQYYIIDLCENLQQKYDDLQNFHDQTESIITSYRGLKLAPSEIYILKHNVGNKIATNGYLSTSRSKDVAYRFAKKGITPLNLETVLIEIDVDITKLSISLVDIADISRFPQEQEVLFDFGASFTITSVDYNEKDKMWMVKLTSVPEELLINQVERLLKNYHFEKDMNILLGQLLFGIKQYTKCRKYFENILKLYENDNENVAKIYEFIGLTYQNETNYDQAIPNYTEAFDRYFFSNRLQHATKMTTFIGDCYYYKKDADRELHFFTKSCTIERNGVRLPENHCEIGRAMFRLGKYRSRNGDKTLACDFLEKALEIYENPSDNCNCTSHDETIASVCETIADIYSYQRHYGKALEYLFKSLKIREKNDISVQGRQRYLGCLSRISVVYLNTGDKRAQSKYSSKWQELFESKPRLKHNSLPNPANDITTDIYQRIQLRTPDDEEFHLIFEKASELLKQYEKAQPQNYDQIAKTNFTLGTVYLKRNDIQWALIHYEKALSLYQTYLPDNTQNITVTARKLCEIYLNQNDFKKSFDFAIKATNLDEKRIRFENGIKDVEEDEEYCLYIGEGTVNPVNLQSSTELQDHLDVIIAFCYQNVAVSYTNLRNYASIIINHCTKAIQLYERHLFDDQEDYQQINAKQCTMYCHFILGCIYQRSQEYHKSNEHFNRSLTLQKNDKDYHIGDCYVRITFNYVETSEYSLSEEYLNKTVDSYLKHIDNHPDCNHRFHIIGRLIPIGKLYEAKGQYSGVADVLLKQIKITERVLLNHALGLESLAGSHLALGHSFMTDKQYHTAINHYEQTLSLYDSNPTIETKNYGEIYRCMGSCYSKMGKNQYQNAIDYTLKAIKYYEEDSQGRDKSGIALNYYSYGVILYERGEYDHAMKAIHTSLELWESIYPVNQWTPFCYIILAVYCLKKLDYQQALHYAKTAVEGYEKQFPDLNDEKIGAIYCVMVLSLLRNGQYDESLSYAIKSNQIMDAISSTITVSKADGHSVLALIYAKQEQYEKCKEHYNIALGICKQLINDGGDIENIGGVFENIGEVYKDLHKLKKARKYYKKTLKYFQLNKEDNHPDIQRIQNILDELSSSSTGDVLIL